MDVEESAGDMPVIGIFMHGGGYCHMSAHETAPTSQIPARLIEVSFPQTLLGLDMRGPWARGMWARVCSSVCG